MKGQIKSTMMQRKRNIRSRQRRLQALAFIPSHHSVSITPPVR